MKKENKNIAHFKDEGDFYTLQLTKDGKLPEDKMYPFGELETESFTNKGDAVDFAKRHGWEANFDFGKGGDVENKGVDLFEDYENIPKKVQTILDKYEDAFMDGDYDGLAKAKDELEEIGYTFEYYLDGVAYDLRKIGEMGKVDYAEKHHIGLMASGGALIFERVGDHPFPYEISNEDYVARMKVGKYPYKLSDEQEEKMYKELGLKKYSLSQYELMHRYAKLKGDTVYGKGGKLPMPEKGTPEWHQLGVAYKTIKMPSEMAGVTGGMTKEEAWELLGKYGFKKAVHIFSADDVEVFVEKINSCIKAPYVHAYYSDLGGEKNVSVLLTVSLDEKSSWKYDILENSRYGKFHIYRDGTIEKFSGSLPKMRKAKAKSQQDVIDKINSYLNSTKMETGGEVKNFTIEEKESKNSYGEKEVTYIMNLGQVDVGNNHTESHLMKALSERADAYEISEAIGDMKWDANLKIVYKDKYGNKYDDVFVVEEFPRNKVYSYKKGGAVKNNFKNIVKNIFSAFADDGALITGGSYFGSGSKMSDGGEASAAPMSDEGKKESRRKFWAEVNERNKKKIEERWATGKPKTREVFYVQGNYGSGWDDLTAHDTLYDAKKELKVYDTNESYPHRVISRRIKREDYEKGNYELGGKAGKKKSGKEKAASKKSKPEPKKEDLEWNEVALNELRKHEGDDDIEVSRDDIGYNGFEAESGGSSWLVFANEDDAKSYAVNQVREDLENEPELFTKSWLNKFIYISDTDKRIIAGEQADMEVEGMSDDELIEEAGMESEKTDLEEKISNLETEMEKLESGDEDNSDEITTKEREKAELELDLESLPDKAKDKVQSDRADEIESKLDDPIRYFVDEQGIYSAGDLLKQSFIRIDEDKAAEDAIDEDGIAHFVARYDGEQIDLPSGAVAYKN